MSRFFSTRYLRHRSTIDRPVIENDRGCDGCGYNLRGLRVGGQCPECGAPITFAGLPRGTLADAPVPDVQRLATGFIVAGTCVTLMMGLTFGAVRLDAAKNLIGPAVVLTAVAWCVAAWMMTPVLDVPEGRQRGFSRASRLRRAARWLQIGWPVGLATTLLLAAWAPRPAIAWTLGGLAVVATLAGIAGLAMLALLLRRLAEWCANDLAERALDLTAFGLAIALASVCLGLIPPLRIALCVAALAWVAALLVFLVGLITLGDSVRWSLRHARQRLDRVRRQRDRMVRVPAATAPPLDDRDVPLT